MAGSGKERFIPIGVKLIGIVSAILVASLGGMTLIATSYFGDDIERNVNQNSFSNAKFIAQQAETSFKAMLDRGSLVAAALRGGITLKDTGEGLGASLLAQDSGIAGVCLCAPSGGAEPGRSIFSDAWLESSGISAAEALAALTPGTLAPAIGGKTAALNLSAALGKGIPLIALARPLSGGAEILVVFADQAKVIAALSTNDIYDSFIADGTGRVVAHRDEAPMLAAADFSANPIVKDSLSSPVSAVPSKQLAFNYAGASWYGSYYVFMGGELTAFSLIQRDKALASVYELQSRNVLITVLFLCAAIFTLYFFSRTITTPIKRLVGGTAMIREGKFDVSIPVRGHDEIGRLTSSFTEMGRGLSEREKYKDALVKFSNPEVAERAARGELALGGEDKDVAIFFSDIRSFTAISEKLSPAEVVEFLNDYMTRMCECVDKTHGNVDKFIGDAVMAVWGAPLSYGNDVENAVSGALLMRRALAEFNAGRGGDKKPVIRIGCGINCGHVIAGNVGSSTKLSYTVIGDAVNLASRIEALNKPFRTDILISEEAYRRVKGLFRVEPMKRITVKGKSEPQQIYAVVGREDDPACPANLDEVRKALGIPLGALGDVDPDAHEEKYEILE